MNIMEKTGKVILTTIKYLSLVFFSFFALLPIVSCVITAFKTDREYQNTNVMTLPESWLNFSNFVDAFKKAGMARAFINSTVILIFVLVFSTILGTQLAYVLDRFKFTGIISEISSPQAEHFLAATAFSHPHSQIRTSSSYD